ncbi:MAG: hypothetical protein UEU47_14095, partial [Oscillospiraceae bacterium]|nr:hypothetical protein [Oscillospiraceae bacterium]
RNTGTGKGYQPQLQQKTIAGATDAFEVISSRFHLHLLDTAVFCNFLLIIRKFVEICKGFAAYLT